VSKIIFVSERPRFIDAGEHLRCELTSGDKTTAYFIPWHFVIHALPDCAAALDAHMGRANNVTLLRGEG
jgi:hypothetical protein